MDTLFKSFLSAYLTIVENILKRAICPVESESSVGISIELSALILY